MPWKTFSYGAIFEGYWEMSTRIMYIALTLITIILGLLSRASFVALPSYVGDVLWAVMVFWIIYAIFPKIKRVKVAFFALLFSYSIELLQLYHAVWIEEIRHTLLGGLILGFSFSLLSYIKTLTL